MSARRGPWTPITIRTEPSTLRIRNGLLPVRVVQCATGATPGVGSHATAPAGAPVSPEVALPVATVLADRPVEGLTAVGWHPGFATHGFAPEPESTIAVGLGQVDGQDRVRVVGPDIDLTIAKTCMSQGDLAAKLTPGDEVVIFEKPAGDDRDDFVSWAVLNCFEYTHPEVVVALEEAEVEVVAVLSANIGSRLYWEYAYADVHRLFAYVVLANIAECGGSGVFGPIRRMGSKATGKLSVGGQLLASRGAGAVTLDIDLSIADLRSAKEGFATHGFFAIEKEDRQVLSRAADMMVPSQRYIDTGDGVGLRAPVSAPPADVTMDWHDGDVVTVGVAQLASAAAEDYSEAGYRLSGSDHLPKLERHLTRWLRHASEVESASGRPLDMLLIPEVFVPRASLGLVQAFARDHRCTVVAGFDYPDDGRNANECLVISRDGKTETWYHKITRSQYDGKLPEADQDDEEPKRNRLDMVRGDRLVRFHQDGGRSFGVLICYDFSHVGLMQQLNLDGGGEPLDLVAVVAHNPFGTLYRSGCIADAHRYYQYVAMANVATFGGSGIFAPMRRKGPRQVLAEVGVGTEGIAVADLDLRLLAAGRDHGRWTADPEDDATKALEKRFMNPSAVTQRRVVRAR